MDLVYVLSDISTNIHSGSGGLYSEYRDLMYVLSNVSTIHNSVKSVLCIECTEELYAEQWYYVLFVIKLAKTLVREF